MHLTKSERKLSEFVDGNGERYSRNSSLPIVFNVAKGYLHFKDSVGQMYLKCMKGQAVVFNYLDRNLPVHSGKGCYVRDTQRTNATIA